MKKYHVISAKRMGWEQIYDYYPFPVDKYTKESALSMFCPITKKTIKNNGQAYEYTAYEYENEIYYDIIYAGICDENDLLSRGFSRDELNNM